MNKRLGPLLTLLLFCITSIDAVAPQHSFHVELDDFLATHNEGAPQSPDFIDKMCISIFSAALPKGALITRLTPTDTPLLIESIVTFCKLHDIPVPRVYLAHDHQNIDLKFCTYDLNGGLLFHKKTFSQLSTRVFRGYLQQTLLRMSKHFAHHKKLILQKRYENSIGITALGTVNLLGFLASLAVRSKVGRFFLGLVQLGIAGGTGAYLYRMLTQRMSTHSYERVSSFHNDEQAREDIFPGNTPEESLRPTFDAPPEHLLKVITDTQEFITQRNAEYDQLREWEADEKDELLRQPDDEPSQ